MSGVSENQNSLLDARSKLVEGRRAAEEGKNAFDNTRKPAEDAEGARLKALGMAQAILRKLNEVEDDLSELDAVLNSGRLACVHVKIAAGNTIGSFGTSKDHASAAATLINNTTADSSSARRAALSASESQERAHRTDQAAQDFETSFMRAKDKTETFALSTHPAAVKQMKDLVGKVAAIGQEDFGLPSTAGSLPFGEQTVAAFDASIEQVDQYTQNL